MIDSRSGQVIGMTDELRVTPAGLNRAARCFGDATEDLRWVGRATAGFSGAPLPPPAAAVMDGLLADWHDELERLHRFTYGVAEASALSADNYLLTDLEAGELIARVPADLDFDARPR